MKRGTLNHPKVLRLQDELDAPAYVAIGVLESLWHFTAQYATSGAIGKWPNTAIARGIGWNPSDADRLIEALINSKWLDESENYRLVVHDWPQHCDGTTHLNLARNGEIFADGTKPSITKLTSEERERLQRKHKRDRELQKGPAQDQPETSTKPALPNRSEPIPTEPNLADPIPVQAPDQQDSESAKNSASSLLTEKKQDNGKKREPTAVSAVLSSTVPKPEFNGTKFRATAVTDTATDIITITAEPHWREWWLSVCGSLYDAPDGWPMLCEHVDHVRNCADPDTRRKKDLGELRDAGGYLVSRVTQWMKAHQLRWPAFPVKEKA